jgi:hypothetical protein
MVINPDGSIQFERIEVPGQQRGAAAASKSADLAAQNRAARLAKYGPDMVTKMETAGARFGGTGAPAAATPAPSVATATNPAPVATSAAASGLNIGQRIMRVLQGGGRLLGAAGVGAVGGSTALTVAGKTTEDYEKELSGLGVSQNPAYESPALRAVRDIGVRGLGALVDLGRAVNPFGGAATPPAITPTGGAAAAAPALPPINAEALMTGTAVPAPGTGAFRVGNRRAVAVDSRGAAAEAAPVIAAARQSTAPAAPVLGTEGGIFSNLVQFQKDLGKQKIAAATEAREFGRGVKLGTLGAAQQTAASAAENAVSNRIKAIADIETALGSGRKVTTDLMGNPVIVDTKTRTALAPTVNKPVTDADIAATMKANKMTREQVLARLRAEGRID